MYRKQNLNLNLIHKVLHFLYRDYVTETICCLKIRAQVQQCQVQSISYSIL